MWAKHAWSARKNWMLVALLGDSTAHWHGAFCLSGCVSQLLVQPASCPCCVLARGNCAFWC